MNAIFSGVMASAAMIRSPSFSRSASSTTITMSPRATAATAFSISVKGISFSLVEESLDVLGEHVDFEVDGIAGRLGAQRGDGEGVRDDGDVERVAAVIEGRHGQADAVDGDGALLDDVAQHVGRRREGHAGGAVGQRDAFAQGADPVDVTLHDV